MLKEFWFGIETEPPIIPEIFLTSLLLFCTTYLYQATFSALVIIKLKHRSALKNTDYFLCPEASNTQARLNFFSPGWSGTYYIDEDDFELLMLLPSARIIGMHHHAYVKLTTSISVQFLFMFNKRGNNSIPKNYFKIDLRFIINKCLVCLFDIFQIDEATSMCYYAGLIKNVLEKATFYLKILKSFCFDGT